MAAINYEALTVYATSSGTYGTYSARTYTGLVHAIRYVSANTTTSYTPSTGGSVAMTGERSGLTVLEFADTSTAGQNTYYPRATNHTTTGGASTGASPVPLYNERLLVTFTSGSTTATTKRATVYVYVS